MGKTKRALGTLGAAVAWLACSMVQSPPARATEFETGNPDIKLRWDNTIKYSAGYRLKQRDPALLSDINQDDGDRNFSKGLMSSRVDLLSELDISRNNLGVRVSAAGWYDQLYNRGNNNNSPATVNSFDVPFSQFTAATRRIMGRDAEFLDVFAYGKADIAGMPGTLRAGRHALVYGESLFFGSNGIASAQGPIDLVKQLGVPGSQFKEILRPVPQLSGQLQISQNVSVGGYYQFQWEESRIPPAGSYLSVSDVLGDGAERIFVGAPLVPGGGPAAFWRGPDIRGRHSGQGGLQLRFTPDGTDLEFGLYAARYHDKTPYLYFDASHPALVNPLTGQVGLLREVYAGAIATYGASLSTVVAGVNVAGEVSVRRHTSLVSAAQTVLPGMQADNDQHPLYAIGNSLHAQASAVYVFTPNALMQGGSLLAEVAWHRRTSVTQNPAALDSNTTRDAWAMRVLFSPAYYQVAQSLDIALPLGLGYNPGGRSSVISLFNGGSSHGGDLSVGLNATYRQVWHAGVNYLHYLGAAGTFLAPPNSPAPFYSFKQSLKDRDSLSFSLQRTF